MVRVSRRRMIELQRSALRALELEAEVREHRQAAAAARAQAELCRRSLRLSDSERQAAAGLAVDPPLTAEGELHEAAFAAAVDAAVWEQRERELAL